MAHLLLPLVDLNELAKDKPRLFELLDHILKLHIYDSGPAIDMLAPVLTPELISEYLPHGQTSMKPDRLRLLHKYVTREHIRYAIDNLEGFFSWIHILGEKLDREMVRDIIERDFRTVTALPKHLIDRDQVVSYLKDLSPSFATDDTLDTMPLDKIIARYSRYEFVSRM